MCPEKPGLCVSVIQYSASHIQQRVCPEKPGLCVSVIQYATNKVLSSNEEFSQNLVSTEHHSKRFLSVLLAKYITALGAEMSFRHHDLQIFSLKLKKYD